MRRCRQVLPLLATLSLAACARAPSLPRIPLAHRPIPTHAPAPATPSPDAAAAAVLPPPAVDLWDSLRDSFAMDDCDADPEVRSWARRFTRHPEQFESKLEAVLPRLVFVQQVAAQYDVPGEFALLPWVESHFQPVIGKRGRPAGMWQIMPTTAGAMGLRVDGHYDGRLDVPASAHAVMQLLRGYHDQFGDWRVADYAYNAGAFAISRMIDKHGAPPATPAVPTLPVRHVTRAHLTKLLAIACVVREPEHFGVTLPTLAHDRRLVKVPIRRSMPMSVAARHAGMSVDALRSFNAGFRSSFVDASKVSYLLLPAGHAKRFRAALDDPAMPMGLLITQDAVSEPVDTLPAATQAGGNRAGSSRTYTVRSGDNLWEIARQYATDVGSLRRWNGLKQATLRPGQVLKVTAPTDA